MTQTQRLLVQAGTLLPIGLSIVTQLASRQMLERAYAVAACIALGLTSALCVLIGLGN